MKKYRAYIQIALSLLGFAWLIGAAIGNSIPALAVGLLLYLFARIDRIEELLAERRDVTVHQTQYVAGMPFPPPPLYRP
jgi:hypothetical protein